jgi:hypothetical protein
MIPIQDELPKIVRCLREPAGDDPRFGSLELIRENGPAFIGHAHEAWKDLHRRSLDEILRIEQILTPEGRRRLPKDFIWYLDRTALLWRRINDALVWIIVSMQDHVIRTVCHRKDRPRLSEANPGAMLTFLERVNADPLTIVIWSDATTCVDVGDIVCRSFSGDLNGFLEVKEGPMNDRILDLMSTSGTPEEIAAHIQDFCEQHGPKAVMQLERVVRQRERHNQYMDILDRDHGFDPRRQAEVTLSESKVAVKLYDRELQETIDRSENGPVLHCVDQCLWVYVDRDRSKPVEQKVQQFQEAFASSSPESMQWFRQQFGQAEPFSPSIVESNLSCPEAVPLFLRQLEPDTISDLLMGKLMFSVFLFLDWYQFGRMIAGMGGELVL